MVHGKSFTCVLNPRFSLTPALSKTDGPVALIGYSVDLDQSLTVSRTAGGTELCTGHLVYRDCVYDDSGANHPIPTIRWNPLSVNALVLPAGDDAYRRGAENAADLIRFEMWLDGDQVQVRFELNTLYDAKQTIAVVAIDGDNNLATGGGRWPGFNTGSQGWDEIHSFTDGDPGQNLISGHFTKPRGAATHAGFHERVYTSAYTLPPDAQSAQPADRAGLWRT